MNSTRVFRVNADERRLIQFYRGLNPRQRFEVHKSVLANAMQRLLPNRILDDFQPDSAGEHRLHWKSSWDESTPAGQMRRGLQEVGEITEYLEGSADYDDEAIARILGYIDAVLVDHPEEYYFSEEDVRSFIAEWRNGIARACEEVCSRMAKSVADASAQEIEVPVDLANWMDYALTLDGDRIAEELDYPEPGTHDVVFHPPFTEMTILDLRICLYEKLRFLQRKGREATEEELRQIKDVLDWIRDQQQRDAL